jgi:hypothetical protein
MLKTNPSNHLFPCRHHRDIQSGRMRPHRSIGGPVEPSKCLIFTTEIDRLDSPPESFQGGENSPILQEHDEEESVSNYPL